MSKVHKSQSSWIFHQFIFSLNGKRSRKSRKKPANSTILNFSALLRLLDTVSSQHNRTQVVGREKREKIQSIPEGEFVHDLQTLIALFVSIQFVWIKVLCVVILCVMKDESYFFESIIFSPLLSGQSMLFVHYLCIDRITQFRYIPSWGQVNNWFYVEKIYIN